VASVGGQIRVYAAEAAALWVIDATDPDNLVPIGQEPLQEAGLALDVVGSLAYVGDGHALRIFDVSNPTDPAPRGVLGTSGSVVDVDVVGNRAYLAEHDSFALRVVDVSNPNLPLPLGSIVTQENVGGVVVRDGLAYFPNGLAGLRIFNVTNPASPVPLGQLVLDTPGITEYAQDVALEGKTAYVITSSSLWIVDVSDPSDPVVRARADYVNRPNEGGTHIVVRNGKAYVARLAGGLTSFDLAIWDVSSPGGLGPVEIASATGFAGGGGIAADLATGLVAVAGGTEGVHLLDATAVLDAHPCLDGVDNDGDGLVDAADGGCQGGGDPSEERDCHDGLDNDGDGLVDYPADPGCSGPAGREDAQCQDGVDNDGDGATDHPADSRCKSPADDDELLNPPPKGCGLGFEIALALLALGAARRRRAA
jgi:hypothetical protein